MYSKRIGLATILLLVLCSCTDRKQEGLYQREQELQLRENAFAAKEKEYKELLNLRDSLRQADSLKNAAAGVIARTWPDSLAGAWNSRMLCRESSCKNYVIGDQRTEKWVFSSDSLGLTVQVMDNDKLKRQLRAELSTSGIRLSLEPDTIATGSIRITGSLDDIRSKLIRGSQSLTGKDNCTAKFSVELTPYTKK